LIFGKLYKKRGVKQKMEKKAPEINVEIKKVASLKEEIVKNNNLEGHELAFKIITHNSPYETRYEPIKTDFMEVISNLLKKANISGVVKRLRN